MEKNFLPAMLKKRSYGKVRMRTGKMMDLLLALVLLLYTAIPVLAAPPGDLTDIPDNWSKAAIEAAISHGLLTGSDNKIMPNANLKRGEMAAIVNRAFGASQKGSISKFTDVSAGKWYADDMAKAVQMGTFKGNGNQMGPENFITRQEAFTALARAFKLKSTDYGPLDQFSDKSQISDWAKPELAALVAAGYIQGREGKLDPTAHVTRAEFAQAMHHILKTYIQAPGTYTTVADGNVMINVPEVTLKGVTVKGDLIIGDGVGTGNVTLDGVKVEGRTVVRGGGKNSIHVINGSTINGTMIIDNVNYEVRIVTDQGTTVQKLEAGSQVILEGSFGEVTVIGNKSSTTSVEVKGNIQTLNAETKAELILTSGTVSKINVAQTAGGTIISTAQGAIVETVIAHAQADIMGNGAVTNVEAKANDVKVDTLGTKVSVGQGVTGVTAGGNAVAGGSAIITTAAATGGSGGGGSAHTSSANADLTGIALSAGTLYPVFVSNTTQYYVSLPDHTNSIMVTPATAESHATAKVNNTDASSPVALSSGLNTVEIVVTAQNGSTKTYQIQVMCADAVSVFDNTASDAPNTSEIYNNSYDFTTSGTYGPASGTAAITGSVTIKAAGITLKNMKIVGDLTFGREIGIGDAAINNVTASGNTIINGGGSHSIHIQGDSALGNITVDDQTAIPDNTIRIVGEGISQIESIDVKTPVIIEDNSSNANSSIGYVKAVEPGLATISGNNANALIQNIIAKAQYFIDQAYGEDGKVLPLYGSINMLNNDTNGIHSLKQYLYPLENNDEKNPHNVPEDLEGTYQEVQEAYMDLWSDWYTSFPLLGIVKNSRDMDQPWITRNGYEAAVAEQQYMLNDCYHNFNAFGLSDTNAYQDDTLPGHIDINAINVGNYLDNLQKQLMVESVSVSDSVYTITFKYNNHIFSDEDWNGIVESIEDANSNSFTARAGEDEIRDIGIAGSEFEDVHLKTMILTAKEESVAAGTTITIPLTAFHLGDVSTMIAGDVFDVTSPAIEIQIPLDDQNWEE
ncbi:S-layer homology domain-containing protein [Candidatus Formimonas warabiya]|uniref:SLH domain-containing protein n=1 Tax=Formimonas warabiya TaxID=1761012 RepID=A0A3G1KLV7_FORW1|nr:S-layer homology domain-containing protein [Candidatus Formimonas warabiya]ATW23456.1 hypothetical protein DCMF_00375 [Candidatus Formimonas warabiya]